jgi:hypothetical protein
MNTVFLSTAYFPPISYFAWIAQSEEVWIESSENYQKQSYRNRCHIASPNGLQKLTIPVIKVDGNHTTIKKVLLSAEEPWRNQHWNSIETAYNSSPFFLYYQDEIKDCLFDVHESLWDLNSALLRLLLELLQIKTPIYFSENYQSISDKAIDLRSKIHPKMPLILPKRGDIIAYYQVFSEKNGFLSDLGILDLLCHLGPEAKSYLKRI